MNKAIDKHIHPESAYCAIFGEAVLPNIPSDAEETLRCVMGTLSQHEADMFMLRYRDNMSYASIGKRFNDLSKERVRQIIIKANRKLRCNSRSRILLLGLEAYLNSIIKANEEIKKRCDERIAELEALIRNPSAEMVMHHGQLIDLDYQLHTTTQNIQDMSIDVLDLSVRVWNSLSRAGIKTIKDIMNCTNLRRIQNMGSIGIQEIQDKITALIKTVEVEADHQ